jgi:hypothetical protein
MMPGRTADPNFLSHCVKEYTGIFQTAGILKSRPQQLPVIFYDVFFHLNSLQIYGVWI